MTIDLKKHLTTDLIATILAQEIFPAVLEVAPILTTDGVDIAVKSASASVPETVKPLPVMTAFVPETLTVIPQPAE